MLADDLVYQRRAVAQALSPDSLRARLLIADAVGLGKTLEIGMIISGLARRGRAERVLVVTPRHVLEQMQHELWTRFAIPLVRLDSDGIQRVRQTLPSTRNPFTFFRKVIVFVDTLKSERYRAHLERHRWDVVVIDESHNLSNSETYNNRLARVLAPNTDALILASATPHNGRAESFAELVKLLDPTAIVDPSDYTVADITAIMLGITAAELCTIYRTQFGVLRKYERVMRFDANGRQVPSDIVKAHESDPRKANLGHYVLPFTPVDREKDMTRAHEVFTERLRSR